VRAISFKLSKEELRRINLREMLTIRFQSGERYLVEIRKIDFLDNGEIAVEGIGDELNYELSEE